MTMYLVHRNEDNLGPHDWGVSESNHVVGLFSTESAAISAKEKAEAHAKEIDFEDEYDRRATTITIIPIEVDKFYNDEEAPYLGGASYVE